MDKDREEWQHDWYGILGLEPGASKEVIEKAARKLAAKNHPDKTSDPEAPAKFLMIQKAKEILTDDNKKKVIDDHYAQTKKRKEYEENRWKGVDEQRKRFRDALDAKISKEGDRKQTIDPNEVLREEMKKQTKVMADMRRRNQEMMEKVAHEERFRQTQKEESYMDYRQSVAQGTAMKSKQIKFKWKRSAESQSEDSLFFLLKQFGEIEEVTLVGTKGTSAIITFATDEGARCAVEFYADSTDFRVSYLVEESKRAKVFTHQFTSSQAINEDLTNEINKLRDHSERANYSSLGTVTDDVCGEDGVIDYDKFVEKERRVLAQLRGY